MLLLQHIYQIQGITTYQDVIDMGYKVIVVKDSTSEDDLRLAPVGSVKNNIYKALVEGNPKAYVSTRSEAR